MITTSDNLGYKTAGRLMLAIVALGILPALGGRPALAAGHEGSNTLEYPDKQRPGAVPEIVAPGVICLAERREHGLAFTPDGKELFFATDEGIFEMRFEDGHWTPPAKASLFEKLDQPESPRISPDGQIMSFRQNGDLYTCRRTAGAWSEPEKLPEQINSDRYECGISYTLGTSVYFTSQRPGTKGQCDLFVTQRSDGRYSPPVNLDIFNTPSSECGLYVAPDESFIIFTGYERPDGFGSSDLYVSFMQKDQTWSVPRNMGPEVNKQYAESALGLSPDGKYFFFARGVETASGLSSDIFWVEASIIESLRPTNTSNSPSN